MGGLRLLLRRDRREVWARRYRALAIALIAASGMAMFSGVFSAIDSLFATRDHYYRRGHMADLEIRFLPEDRANLPRLEEAPGIAQAESRLVLPGNLELDDGRRLPATVVGLDLSSGAPNLNRLTILDGEAPDPAHPHRVVIDRNLARYHGFAVGDRLHLRVGNDHYRDLVVRGVALSPEFLLASADPSTFLPDKGSLGVLFVPLELLEERLGFPLVNSLLVDRAAGAEPRKVRREATRRADRTLAVEEVIPRERQFASLFLETDLRAFAVFIPATVLIFALTAVLVTLFLLFQWIAGERREIGLLMALGYGPRRLAAAYLAPVGGLAALGALAGSALSLLTLRGFGSSYAEAIGLPEPILALSPDRVAWGGAGVFAALALAAVWPLRTLLVLTPRDALRLERGAGRPALGPRLRRLAVRFGGRLWVRYAARSVLRGRGAAAMTILAVALALGVSISYFVAMTSFETSLVRRFEDDRWDAVADFLAPVWDDELGMLDGVPGLRAVEPFVRGPVRLEVGGRRTSSLVTGLDPDGSMRRVRMVAGRGLRTGDRDVLLLERQRARELGLDIGDPVTVHSLDRTFQAHLVGLFSGVLPGEAYAPRATLRRWLELDDQNTGVFLRSDSPPAAVRQALYDVDRVGRVTLSSELSERLLDITGEILGILYLSEGFSIAVAVLFLFSSASFLVLERRAEYNTLRILGFSDRSVAGMILTEVVLLGAVGAALAVPVGYALALYLVRRMGDAWFAVELVSSPRDVLTILVPGLLILPFAAWPAIRRVRATPLVATLRERTFG